MTKAANLAALGSNASSTGTLGASSYASATIPNSALSGNPTFRNRIINGNMMIDQRNAGASVTGNDSVFPVDRWRIAASQSSKMTAQQSTTVPAGFKNSLAITSSSAYSIGSGDTFAVAQLIEGLNVSDLGWGTADAQTVTLSFKVRSSLTGTFGGSLANDAFNRSYPFSYTISSANTWETKTVTIAGDTSGTWLTTNGIGLRIYFGLGCGSTYSSTAGSWASGTYLSATGATSVVGTNGATFYITGVQLEVGSSASPFEQRLYGTELALCQRYFYSLNANGLTLTGASTNRANGTLVMPVTMRTNPTATGSNCNRITNFQITDYSGTYQFSVENNQSNSQLGIHFYVLSGATWSTGLPLAVNDTSQVTTVKVSAEL